MVVMEKRPELKVDSGCEAELRVEPGDISFHDVTGGNVRIQVKVRNAGAGRSEPTTMVLESAPLGAFVPWRPLAQLPVPALEPGESHIVSTEARRPTPLTLGAFDRVPPRTLLTAVNAPDQSAPNVTRGWLSNLLRRQPTQSPDEATRETPSLASDLWDLLENPQPYWAGNLNVFVGGRAVERHLAQALRIYPGRINYAMFVVGSPGKREEFAFELVGLEPDWEAALYELTPGQTLLPGPSDTPLTAREWVTSNGGLVVILNTRPPIICDVGKLAVQVTRKGSGERAVVEFDLDPAAKGSGCYLV